MALEFVKLIKGKDVFSQVGNLGFFKLGVESGGGDNSVVTYGVKIDLANSNPETSVTYTDDAVGFNKSYMDFANDKFEYGSWADKFPFNQIKPCILKNGVVTTYLNPNNYAEDVDGNPVDITTKCDGDVMIEIPKIYYYLHKDENYQYIQISNTKVNDNFCCLAHTYRGVEKDKVYIGAYQSYYDGYKSRSWSGVSATGSMKFFAWRVASKVHGNGYEVFYWNLLVLLQCLYLIQFKNLNSQEALGYGWNDASDFSIGGGLNQKGLYYGTSTNGQMKFMGIEDFYGSRSSYIDGAYINGTSLTVADVTSPDMEFSGTGVGYKTVATGLTTTYGYFTKILGDNNSGFCPQGFSGSETTYYSDLGQVSSNKIAYWGSTRTSKGYGGAFSLSFGLNDDTVAATRGARLAYCG